jgi:hypothetical protein
VRGFRKVLLSVSVLLLLCVPAIVGNDGASGAARAHRAPQSDSLRAHRGHGAVVWAVGDGADGGEHGRAVARMIDRWRIDRFLYLGDVYEDGTAREFAHDYDPLFGRFARKTLPTIGNHEWADRKAGYNPYWTSVFGRRPGLWYERSIAGWQVLSLNSEAHHGRGSRQLGWLRRELARTRQVGDCRIAFWHRPRYASGGRQDAPDMARIWNQLEGRAVLVLNGHAHNMQQIRRQGGTTELISGAGGHGLDDVAESDPRLRFWNDTTYGALRIHLAHTRRGGTSRARFAFTAANGRVLHHDSIGCRRR